jgi:TPR repeat protein
MDGVRGQNWDDVQCWVKALNPQQLKTLRASAERGHASAQCKLGVQLHTSHLEGRSCEGCPEVAAAWFRKAAEQGHAEAQMHLSQCYALGQAEAGFLRQTRPCSACV